MRGAPANHPKYEALNEMLAAVAQSNASLSVKRKEQDQEVPMACVRQRALSIAADLVAHGVRRGGRVALGHPRAKFTRRVNNVVAETNP